MVQKRVIFSLVLMAYSAILVQVVVFKDKMRLPLWMHSSREDVWVHPPGEGPAADGQPARGRGARGGLGRRGPRPGEPPIPQSRFHPLHANLVPFKTILPQLRGEPRWSSAIINLLGNTVLFVPLGFLVTLVYPRIRWRTALAVAVAVGLAMEGMEGLFRVGIVDVDDVILNALGVMIGYCLCRGWERRRETAAHSTARAIAG